MSLPMCGQLIQNLGFFAEHTEPGSGSQWAIGFEDTQLTCRHLERSFQLWI